MLIGAYTPHTAPVPQLSGPSVAHRKARSHGNNVLPENRMKNAAVAANVGAMANRHPTATSSCGARRYDSPVYVLMLPVWEAEAVRLEEQVLEHPAAPVSASRPNESCQFRLQPVRVDLQVGVFGVGVPALVLNVL